MSTDVGSRSSRRSRGWTRSSRTERRLARIASVVLLGLLATCLIPRLEIAFALLVPLVPVALTALGHLTTGRRSWAWLYVALALWLEAVVVALLMLRGDDAGPWILGLPRAMAIQVYGILVVPLPVMVVAYLLAFEAATVSATETVSVTEPETDR